MARRSNEQILSDLIQEGATLLAEAYPLHQSLTETYRKLANVIVDIRKRFIRSDGAGPDWRGTTQDYRNVVNTMYEQSGVPADSVSNMQAAIRYHIGNVLRERLTEEELASVGLSKEGPLARAQAARSAGGGAAPVVDFDVAVEILKEEGEHPGVIFIDLRDEDEGIDPVPLVRQALNLLQHASQQAVTDKNASAMSAILDQVIAEAAAFRAQVHAITTPVKRAAARR